MNIKGQSFLKLLDFTPEQIAEFLALAAELKAKKKAGIPHRLCEGKQAALIFEKTSTRTRCSFEVAAHDLGMTVTYLDPSGSQIGKKESIADTARVLGRMYDGIEYRGYGQQIVEELAKYAGVPVWNGLTNEFHPTQILADFLTIQEHFGNLTGKKLVYMGRADRRGAGIRHRADARGSKRGCDLYRRVGLDGRTGRGLADENSRPAPLSGQRKAHGAGRAAVPLHALPARVPRSEHHHRQTDQREIRT